MTDPFPAPVAPATRTWEPSSRSSHGDPSSHRPIASPARSTRSAMGRAGTGAASASRRTSSSTISPGAAGRTRHRWTPNPCARPSARSAKSAGDWPETSLTVTRSTGPPAATSAITGSRTRPRYSGARPVIVITASQRRR